MQFIWVLLAQVYASANGISENASGQAQMRRGVEDLPNGRVLVTDPPSIARSLLQRQKRDRVVLPVPPTPQKPPSSFVERAALANKLLVAASLLDKRIDLEEASNADKLKKKIADKIAHGKGADEDLENMNALSTLSKSLREMNSDFKNKLLAIVNDFASAFGQQSTAISNAFVATSNMHDDNAADAEKTVKPLTIDIDKIIDPVIKAQKEYSKATQDHKKTGEQQSALFDSALAKLKSDFQKAEFTNVKAAMAEQKSMSAAATKFIDSNVGVVGKMTSAMDKETMKAMQKADKFQLKDEKKYASLEEKLMELQADIQENENRADAAEDTAQFTLGRVADGRDVEQPGLETVAAKKEKAVAEFEKHQSRLHRTFEKESSYFLEDLIDNLDEIKDEGQLTLADDREEAAKNGETFVEKLAGPVEQVAGANTNQMAALQEEQKVVMALAVAAAQTLEQSKYQTETEGENMESTIKETLAKMQALLDSNMEKMQKTFEEKTLENEQYIDAAGAAATTDFKSKNQKVLMEALNSLIRNDNWIKSRFESALGTIDTGAKQIVGEYDKDKAVKEKIEQMKNLMTTLSTHAPAIDQIAAQVLTSGTSDLQDGEALSKETFSRLQDDAYKATVGIVNTLEKTGVFIAGTTADLTEHIGETAGEAAAAMDDAQKLNMNQNAQLRGRIAISWENLKTIIGVLIKTLATQKDIVENLPEAGAAISGSFSDEGFRSQKQQQEIVPMIDSDIKEQIYRTDDTFVNTMEQLNQLLSNSKNGIAQSIAGIAKKLNAYEKQIKTAQKEAAVREYSIGEQLTKARDRVEDLTLKSDAKFNALNSSIKDLVTEGINLVAQNAKDFKNISDSTHDSVGAVGENYRQLVSEEVLKYTDLINKAMEDLNKELVQLKGHIKESTAVDQADFKTVLSKAQDKIAGVSAGLSRLALVMVNSANSEESIAKALAAFRVAKTAEKSISDTIKNINEEVHNLSKKAAAEIGAERVNSDALQSEFKSRVTGLLGNLQKGTAQAEAQLTERLRGVSSELGMDASRYTAMLQAGGDDLRSQERGIQSSSAVMAKAMADEANRLEMGYRQEALAAMAENQAEQSEVAREGDEAAQVAQGLAKRSGGVDAMFASAEKKSQKHIQALMTDTDKNALIQTMVGELVLAFKDESKSTTQLIYRAEALAKALADRVDDQIKNQVEAISDSEPLVTKLQVKTDKYWQDVEDDVQPLHDDMDSLVNEASELATELKIHMKQKNDDMTHMMSEMESDVDEMEEMQKYQSRDAVEKVVEQLDEEVAQSEDIWKMVSEEVKQRTREYRTRFGQVFQDMGLDLDIERVNQMANESLAEEESIRERLSKSRQAMEETMREVNRAMQRNLTRIYEQTKADIARVQAMNHLTAAEKQQRIMEIKRAAARQTQQTMTRGRLLVERQNQALHGMEKKENEIGVLLARAKMLSEGAFQTMPRSELMDMMAKIKEGLSEAKDKYVSPFSLIEEGDVRKDPWLIPSSLLAIEDVMSGNDTPLPALPAKGAPPSAILKADEKNLAYLDTQRAETDASWEAQLSALGAVMPM